MLRDGCKLAEVSVARELLGVDGCGAGAGAALKCELLPAGGGCEPLDLLLLDFTTLDGDFALVLIELVVAEAVRVVAFAAGAGAGVEFPAGADFLATIAADFMGVGTGAGAGAGATVGAFETLLAGARTSGAVDNTISTGASAAAARALVAAFAALTAAAAGRVYAGATVAVAAGSAAADDAAA